ncbi:hypothetical protein CANARDRAFT_109528 [[Candida] arabinofermentans NRRL YB-2248]|uniref:Uncharacterized protein n=1 Tax=[Candida] arabinofermentans NRRL YB-2248 TaxID=983967 RepID=A0A1E4STI3_9ASCO|nr:hypothetical protein CANARDRAFT_109528 [[Candida] arabinofermentans NRRL YB-2248]
MSGLNQRKETKSQDSRSETPITPVKQVLTKNGLKYNREDELNTSKLVKTALLLIYIIILIIYFVSEIYAVICNVVFSSLAAETTALQTAMDAVMIIIKLIMSVYLTKWLNSKFLLQYDDELELKKYD